MSPNFNRESVITIVANANRLRDIERQLNGNRMMVRISKTTIPNTVASITLSNLPQDYSHFILYFVARSQKVATLDTSFIRFNADSGANYDYILDKVNNAGRAASEGLAQTAIYLGDVPGASATASVFGGMVLNILAYNHASMNNGVVVGHQAMKIGVATGNLYTTSISGWWRTTAPITSITLVLGTGNFETGSQVVLYGAP